MRWPAPSASPPRAINEIVLGRRAITPPVSIRFGVFLGQSDDFWHDLQVECEFRALASHTAGFLEIQRTASAASLP